MYSNHIYLPGIELYNVIIKYYVSSFVKNVEARYSVDDPPTSVDL